MGQCPFKSRITFKRRKVFFLSFRCRHFSFFHGNLSLLDKITIYKIGLLARFPLQFVSVWCYVRAPRHSTHAKKSIRHPFPKKPWPRLRKLIKFSCLEPKHTRFQSRKGLSGNSNSVTNLNINEFLTPFSKKALTKVEEIDQIFLRMLPKHTRLQSRKGLSVNLK